MGCFVASCIELLILVGRGPQVTPHALPLEGISLLRMQSVIGDYGSTSAGST